MMASNKLIQKTFPVTDMSCVVCAGTVDKVIKEQPGVASVSVNFATATATIGYDPGMTSPEKLRESVWKAGYDLLIESEEHAVEEAGLAALKRYRKLKRNTIRAIALSVPILIIGMFFMDMPLANEIMWALSTPVVFLLGRGFFINAWKQLRHRSANMDTLIALSTGIAYLFSLFNMLFPEFWISRGVHPHVYFEAASVIIAFILLGRTLEEKAKRNTSSSIRKLMGLQPETVPVINKQGNEEEIAISRVQQGDILVARPGGRIAVDGSVTGGSSYVDESTLSGEPVPVLKEENAKVYAGTVNQKGYFRYRAEKVGADTMLARIINIVRHAQESKAPVQRLVDRIAAVFVPAIMSAAILSFVLWVVLDPADGVTHGLLALVTVLIIACPCALGLATPTAIMAGMGKGAENGILIKDAESLETARKTTAVVLDKTGTLTEGRPVVTDFFRLPEREEAKDIFASMERLSEHPVADAIVHYFEGAPAVAIDNFSSVTGQGVTGSVGGKRYFAGNAGLLERNRIAIDPLLSARADALASESKTVVWFAEETEALAVAGITDRVKENSAKAVAQLKALGIEVWMLTGDNECAARRIASETGITQYKAHVLPDGKAEFVKQLQDEGKTVAMVGDGINDSAALAQADLSIAMGKGSDIAMDVAQMTIISSDLLKIPEAIRLSRLTVRTISQNLFWAFIYNLLAVPIAAGVLYPVNGFLLNPMIAGAAMAFSSVSVVSNSLRLKKKKIQGVL